MIDNIEKEALEYVLGDLSRLDFPISKNNLNALKKYLNENKSLSDDFALYITNKKLELDDINHYDIVNTVNNLVF